MFSYICKEVFVRGLERVVKGPLSSLRYTYYIQDTPPAISQLQYDDSVYIFFLLSLQHD